jgi:outer membrane protein assembly factor BamA
MFFFLRSKFLSQHTVLAWRLGFSSIRGNQIPIQLLLPLGGSRTLRGYPLGRFIDHTAGLTNIELRFPIYSRIGGVLGIDAGRVWPSPDKLSLNNWHSNLVAGLRYYLDTYIVRVDFGLSRETLGIYFNFNHIF